MCDLKYHNLVEVYKNGTYSLMTVVRWCKDCGAIVIDEDSDGRTFAGKFLKMQFPSNIK